MNLVLMSCESERIKLKIEGREIQDLRQNFAHCLPQCLNSLNRSSRVRDADRQRALLRVETVKHLRHSGKGLVIKSEELGCDLHDQNSLLEGGIYSILRQSSIKHLNDQTCRCLLTADGDGEACGSMSLAEKKRSMNQADIRGLLRFPEIFDPQADWR